MTDRSKLYLMIVAKSVLAVIASFSYQMLFHESYYGDLIGPVMYAFVNLLIINSLFFLPLFFVKSKTKKVLKKNVVRLFVLLNTLIFWYSTIPEVGFLIVLFLLDIVLFELYFIRKINFSLREKEGE